MAGIYKAYDIRGIYPDQLSEEVACSIGRAYADILKEELGSKEITIVVGCDMRLSSPRLTESVMDGITGQGVNVVFIGLSSTPTFYFAVARYGYDGGMQISASHNPKEYNGVKIVKAKAYPVSYDTGLNDIERRVHENDFLKCDVKGDVSGREDVLDEELRLSLKYADPGKIKPLKVVADVANSMGAPLLDKLFSKLPCKLVRMNFELDGSFPVHQADPFQEKNIADLKKRVVDEGADLGLATDGDGDRIFFVDDKGELVEPAILRGLLAKIVLRENPGATICYDIRPGRITYDMIVENGGKPVVTRVGHSLIKAQAIDENAIFAGESSGQFFLDIGYGFFEAPMIVVLKILEEISV
ncbi:MAG: phosphomannomutase/phosphoglucomutase, partial [Deltaproteobacteria bacterium]|nr:phosphomannomutase/phosphoglucomutase [Deltaproteobacteria bacterium]